MNSNELITTHLYLVDLVISHEVRRRGNRLGDEIRSIANEALVRAANDWHAHCAKNGHDSTDLDYFAAYSRLRMTGALADEWRARDPLTRTNRKRQRANPDLKFEPSVLRNPLKIEDLPFGADYVGLPLAPDVADDFELQGAIDTTEKVCRSLPAGYVVALALRLRQAPRETWAAGKVTGGQVAAYVALRVQAALAGLYGAPVWKVPARPGLIPAADAWTDDGRVMRMLGVSVSCLIETFYDELRADVQTTVDILALAHDSVRRAGFSVVPGVWPQCAELKIESHPLKNLDAVSN